MESFESTAPYYAVIFTSLRRQQDGDDYAAMAERMLELSRQQPGFLGVESVRDESGLGITVSYWQSLEAIAAWKQNAEHLVAQRLGREQWYERFALRVCRVERETIHKPEAHANECPPRH
jgi:heme-degrading monooxygenase HmoA